MKILTLITYYRPYTSGLTIYCERLAKSLVQLEHHVTVLCMKHDNSSLDYETVDGVKIIRANPSFRLSKGFIAPSFFVHLLREIKKHDIVHLHLPQFEAGFAALISKFFRKPVIITYHCDLELPPSIFNKLAEKIVWLMNTVAALCSEQIITYTQDFAVNSVFLKKFINQVKAIFPPVCVVSLDSETLKRIEQRSQLTQTNFPVIGMAARLAAEKGVEILIDALEIIKKTHPEAKVIFAGQWQDVIGEKKYYQTLIPQIEKLGLSWNFLGILNQKEMSAFYSLLDVLVVPSLNSTESFGLVQIEAMMFGVPVVSSNLPGVRESVRLTGMGKVVEIENAKALASAILEVVTSKGENDFDFEAVFSPISVARKYQDLMQKLLN